MAMKVAAPEEPKIRFKTPDSWLGPLDAHVAAMLVGVAGDIVLCLDPQGVIREIGYGSTDLSPESFDPWTGQKWIDTVTVESRVKIEQMLAGAVSEAQPKWREINQILADGTQFPVRYSVVKVDRDGRLVALGRDLRSVARLQQRLIDVQRSMERDYARLRNAETRYRLLFQLASEAVMIVDAGSEKVVDVNPVASGLLGSAAGRITGRVLGDLFHADSQPNLQALFAATRALGRSDETTVTLRDGATELRMSASLFRNDNANHVLLRLAVPHGEASALAAAEASVPVMDVVKGLPEGFVVMDSAGRILEVNKSFLEMAELASPEQARGEMLDRWLGRPGIDVGLLVANLRDHGSLRDFATIVRGEFGGSEEVEVTAVAVPHGPVPCVGMVIRQTRRRALPAPERATAFSQSVEHLAELVGSVPLKDLVRETTDMIEQMCIEAALKLTDDNRASAAQILGLSRQSLYSKLRRYGLGDLDDDGE